MNNNQMLEKLLEAVDGVALRAVHDRKMFPDNEYLGAYYDGKRNACLEVKGVLMNAIREVLK